MYGQVIHFLKGSKVKLVQHPGSRAGNEACGVYTDTQYEDSRLTYSIALFLLRYLVHNSRG